MAYALGSSLWLLLAVMLLITLLAIWEYQGDDKS